MPHSRRARPSEQTAASAEAVDREKLCPFLLRMYYRQGQHHRVDDFSPTSTPPQSSELRMYTWKNATLGEIASLVKQAIPNLLEEAGAGARLSFRHIYLDLNRGIFVGQNVGFVSLEAPQLLSGSIEEDVSTMESSQHISGPGSTSRITEPIDHSKDYEKTLGSISFVIGDYLDIAVLPALSIEPQLQTSGGPMRHRGRERLGHAGGRNGSNPIVTDRFAGRLGGGIFSRNGRGQGRSGRGGPGGLDVHNEPSWKGRGRGR